jgi:hypothetical protein
MLESTAPGVNGMFSPSMMTCPLLWLRIVIGWLAVPLLRIWMFVSGA